MPKNVVRIQKVLFPNKPVIEKLLNDMVATLTTTGLSEDVKDRVKVAEWIASHNWATFAGPLQSAGLLTDFSTSCAAEIAASKASSTTDQVVQCYLDKFHSKVVTWAVAEYLKEPADQNADGSKSGDVDVPPDEPKGMSAGTMMAIGAGVILLGGVGYYAYTESQKKTSKPNPSVRTGHFGYGDKPTKGLRSTLDSPAMEKAVTKLAKHNFPRARVLDIVYEHGQWWVTVNDQNTYSVVDTSSGLGLEQI